jgi:hypothetical protein
MTAYGPVCLAFLFVAATSSGAWAQGGPASSLWSRGTTINAFGGVSSASSNTGGLVGGAAGWELTARFGFEGSVAWLDRPGVDQAFAAALTARLNLLTQRSVAPFLAGGVGLYHVSVSRAADDLPAFYRRRLQPGVGATQAFTDPSLIAGGGVNLFMSRHWAIRPEILAMVVKRDSRSHLVTTGTVHLAYHFEEHPVTPSQHR